MTRRSTPILCVIPEQTYARVMTPALTEELKSLGDVTFCPNADSLTHEEYAELWKDAAAVVTGWRSRPPTREILDRAESLRVISHAAGTVRMIPRYALEKGILVTSARAAIARTVAEYCLLNAILLLRRYAYFVDAAPERKEFLTGGLPRPESETLYGKTVGLVGYGTISRLFAELLHPFQVRLLVYDPYLPDSALLHDAERVDLPTLLQESRVVSLHAPDIPETRGMIGTKELSLLRDGAILLNSARGKLIQTEALTEALLTRRFSAAIDVTDPEPLPPDHPLRSLPNVLLTPHIAGPTNDDLPELARMAIHDLRLVLEGAQPLYPITLEAYDRMSF